MGGARAHSEASGRILRFLVERLRARVAGLASICYRAAAAYWHVYCVYSAVRLAVGKLFRNSEIKSLENYYHVSFAVLHSSTHCAGVSKTSLQTAAVLKRRRERERASERERERERCKKRERERERDVKKESEVLCTQGKLKRVKEFSSIQFNSIQLLSLLLKSIASEPSLLHIFSYFHTHDIILWRFSSPHPCIKCEWQDRCSSGNHFQWPHPNQPQPQNHACPECSCFGLVLHH